MHHFEASLFWTRLRVQLHLWPPEGAGHTRRWPQHYWPNVTSVVRIVLFLHKSRTDEPRGALTFNVNVWWTSEALHFNVHTRALKKNKKKSHGFSADHQLACCCHVNSNNKTMFAIDFFFVVDSHLWTWILHWLKKLVRSIYSPNSLPIRAHVRCKFEVGQKLELFWQRKGVWATRSWLKLSNSYFVWDPAISSYVFL